MRVKLTGRLGQISGVHLMSLVVASVGAAVVTLPPAAAAAVGVALGTGLQAAGARRFGGGGPVPHAAGSEAIARELGRARRYGHAFAVVRFAGTASTSLGATLDEELRATDVAWCHADDWWVVLPECDRDAAAAHVARLAGRSTLVARLSDEGAIDMASFPADGLTVAALLEALAAREVGLDVPAEAASPIASPAFDPLAAENRATA